MSEKLLAGTVAAVAAAFSIATVAVVYDRSQQEAPAAPVETVQAAAPSVYETNFISGCMEGGAVPRKACQCMYNYLEDVYGAEAMIQMGETLESEATMQALSDAALRCI